VRDVDFNPNRDYFLVTGGDDYKLKFWDTRKCDQPTKVLGGHRHWVWNAKYNRFHDQLVLSSSTDCCVNLWNASSVSSSSKEETSIGVNRDRLIKSFEEHEDSVYSIAWGTNAWMFASLSYDGRLVINYVPQDIQNIVISVD